MSYVFEYASLSIDLYNSKTNQLLHFQIERVFDDCI